MANPTITDVHVNVPLTQFSEAYLQDQNDFVSMVVFPPISVENKSDVFYKYNRGDFFRDDMQATAPGTEAQATGYRLTTGNYNATEYRLIHKIPDSIRRNADKVLNLDQAGTMLLTQKALLNREKKWASTYFAASLWDTTITGASSASAGSTAKYWDSAGSTPIEDILTGKATIKQNTGKDANVLVLGYQTKQALKTNPEIVDRLKYGQTAPGAVQVKDSDLAQLFEVKRVVTMGAIQTTSAEGAAADTFGFIAGKHALLAYAADAPQLMEASAGYTFNWNGLQGTTAAGWRIMKYRWEIVHSDILEIEQNYDFGLVSTALGYFFGSIVQ